MGLTGVIVRASIQLHRTESAYFLVDTDRTADLDELMALLTDGSDDTYGYSAAWFDTTTTGAALGRAVLTRGSLATLDQLPAKQRREPLKFDAPQLLTVPDVFPPGMLNKLTGRIFSELWYRKSPTKLGAVQNITQFLHPLDLVGEWNRGYGPHGFLQYQFVVPFGAEDVIRHTVHRVVETGQVSALNVLKRFGPGNRAPLSFPMPGWTLCVDLPVRKGVHELCEELDELVLNAGGRHYLAKESRATPEVIERGYPRLDEWRKVRASVDPQGVFASDMARRLSL
jgi:decaprenylphospho-beta-D-ribofuranose 2-oxidase